MSSQPDILRSPELDPLKGFSGRFWEIVARYVGLDSLMANRSTGRCVLSARATER